MAWRADSYTGKYFYFQYLFNAILLDRFPGLSVIADGERVFRYVSGSLLPLISFRSNFGNFNLLTHIDLYPVRSSGHVRTPPRFVLQTGTRLSDIALGRGARFETPSFENI